MVNAIWFRFGSVEFRRDFSVCMFTGRWISVSFQLSLGVPLFFWANFFSEPFFSDFFLPLFFDWIFCWFRTWLIFLEAIVHTGSLLGIFLDRAEVWLFAPFSDWLWARRTSVWLEPSGRPFGSRSVGGWRVQTGFSLVRWDFGEISLSMFASRWIYVSF